MNRTELISSEKLATQGLFLIKTKNDNNLNGLDLAQLYRNTTLFEFVEPNFGFTEWSLLNHIPNDLYFPSQWALKNTGQAITTGGIASSGDATTTTGLPGADMQVSDAWNHTTGSPSIKIAIVDTGMILLMLTWSQMY